MNSQTSEDWYILPDGRLVFTAAYHLKRGYCCGAGCLHCPFDWEAVAEPRKSALIAKRNNDKSDESGR